MDFKSATKWLAATLGTALACAAAQAGVPLEVYGRLPTRDHLTISPGGTRLAYVQPLDDGRAVVVLSLQDRKPIEVIKLGAQKLRDIEWADDSHLLVMTSQTVVPRGFTGRPGEWWALEVRDLEKHLITSVPNAAYARELNLLNAITGRPAVRKIDGHPTLFVRVDRLDGRYLEPTLLQVNLDTGGEHRIALGDHATGGWLVDADGKIVAREDYEGDTQAWTIAVDNGKGLQPVDTGHAPIDYPHVTGFSADGRSLLVHDPREGSWHWRMLGLADGRYAQQPPPLGLDEDPLLDRRTQRFIGAVNRETRRYRFDDANLQAHWDAVAQELEGDRLRLVSYSDDFGKIVFEVTGKDGYADYLMDTKKDELSKLGDVYAGIDRPLEVRRVDYAAKDGVPIQAFLTLPRGREAKGLPLVVLAHGGPADRDTADFDWWSQALAEQGYAVLRANFRGSTVDEAFMKSGYGEWGHKMQSDLSDGVRALAKQGLVDPARACIVGASYGGYAALAGVTLETGVYRCAVSVAGPSDLSAMLKWQTTRVWSSEQNHSQRYWDRFMGVSGPDDPRLAAISPALHVEHVQAPVLLIHGDDDTVVPYAQSKTMYDALRAAHKDVALVRLEEEDHGLSSSATRLQMLKAIVEFLAAKNPPN
ncbi:MAG TPA: alpha/beta fold hydrolase [Burkholderiaceae bacterium]